MSSEAVITRNLQDAFAARGIVAEVEPGNISGHVTIRLEMYQADDLARMLGAK